MISIQVTKDITVYDIAIEYYGEPSLKRLFMLNPAIDFSADLTGKTILVDEKTRVDTQKNRDLVQYFVTNNITLQNG